MRLPVISPDGRVAVLYELVHQEPPRVGFAVIDADDRLTSDSLPPVAKEDKAAVAKLNAAAQAFLHRDSWRPMVGADRETVDGAYDHLRWLDLDLTVTLHQDGLQLWFSETSRGATLGQHLSPSQMIKRRGCDYSWTAYSMVINDAAVDPQTRLAVVTLDVIPATDTPPFSCDLSMLVHVVRVAAPQARPPD